MTNWKSYDASIRLIAAILAAHPDLKLNYSATSSHFGSDSTASAIENRMRVIKRDVLRLREAVNDGEDCKMVKLESLAPRGGTVVLMPDHLKYLLDQPRRGNASKKASNIAKGKKEIARHFDDAATTKAVKRQFDWHKKNAAALHAAVDAGVNPLTVDMSIKTSKEIVKRFDTTITPNAVACRFKEIRKAAAAAQVAAENGQNPMTVKLHHLMVPNEIQQHFSANTTRKAVTLQFDQLRKSAIAAREAVKSGVDPMTVDLNHIKATEAIAEYLDNGTTSVALEHRFRGPKRAAVAFRAAKAAGQNPSSIDAMTGKPVAEKFGDGVTSKAVSTRFERLKKEEGFDLSKNLYDSADNDGSAPVTPANPVTPAKRRGVKAATGSSKKRGSIKKEDADEAEEDIGEVTPTPRKSALNTVKSGRVTKPRGRKAAKVEDNIAEEALTDPFDGIEAEDEENTELPPLLDYEEDEEADFA